MRKIGFFALVGICLQVAVLGQASQTTHRLRGNLRDLDSAVIPAASISVKKDGEPTKSGTLSDINGNFELSLSPGDYEVIVWGIPETKFRAFLKITDKGPNPQDVEFVADSLTLCETELKGVPFPKVLKMIVPKFPPAARAVRALGTVTVLGDVAPNGLVTSAKAVSGHPLLRVSSEVAAKQFEFETAEGTESRSVRLSFVYIGSGTPKKEIKRFECMYRIVVVAPEDTLDF